MLQIILTRHGEAIGNVKSELMGCKFGSKLTDKGIEQANALGKYLSTIFEIDYIFSSPVNRAKETTGIINGFLNKEIRYEEDIREVDWGDISGLSVKDIPDEMSQGFHNDPLKYVHPGGESLEQLFDRVGEFIQREIYPNRDQNKTILIVAHDNVIKGMVGYLRGFKREAISLKIENCSLICYKFLENDGLLCEDFNKKI